MVTGKPWDQKKKRHVVKGMKKIWSPLTFGMVLGESFQASRWSIGSVNTSIALFPSAIQRIIKFLFLARVT